MSDRAYTDAELDWHGNPLKFGDKVWLKDGPGKDMAALVLCRVQAADQRLNQYYVVFCDGSRSYESEDRLSRSPPKCKVKKTESVWACVDPTGKFFGVTAVRPHGASTNWVPATLVYEVEE